VVYGAAPAGSSVSGNTECRKLVSENPVCRKPSFLIASGQNAKRLLAYAGRRPKKPAQSAALRPPTPPSAMRAVALASIVRTARGGQRRHFSTRCLVFDTDSSGTPPPRGVSSLAKLRKFSTENFLQTGQMHSGFIRNSLGIHRRVLLLNDVKAHLGTLPR
jgi:hypothetical protein